RARPHLRRSRIVVLRCLRFAVAYLMIGVVMGIVMGITRQFQYAPVHAHINLLGWVSLAVMGLIYKAFPHAAETRLARMHFRLDNVGLPVFMLGLALLINDQGVALRAVQIGAFMMLAAITMFVVNLLRTVRIPQPMPAAA